MIHCALCVFAGATTAHSVEHGFRTVLIEDAARGVDVNDMKKTHDKLLRQGAALVNCDSVSCFRHKIKWHIMVISYVVYHRFKYQPIP